MATTELARPAAAPGSITVSRHKAELSPLQYFSTRLLTFLSSLRLTVVLFALAIFLIFVGTLAQVDHDVWDVVRHSYFRVWFAWVEFQTFERFAQLFSRSIDWKLTGGFYFPGGKLIGLALFANLLAAHAIRFRIAASGTRLWSGLLTILAGMAATYFVIQTGTDDVIESDISPAIADGLWQAMRASLVIVALAGIYFLFASYHRVRRAEWCVLVAIEFLVASLAVWLLVNPDLRLDNSGLRILWQLVKATGAAIILLIGCVLVFRKRAGIVLLHGGIALMMLSELFTAMMAHESQMTIPEGGASNWSQDIRAAELAVIDHSNPEVDGVTVVPASLLADNVDGGERIEHPDLPFSLKVHRWIENSDLVKPSETMPNPATAGFGRSTVARELPTATGVEGGRVDLASAYVELFSQQTGESKGTYLVSQHLVDQPLEVDGKKYDLALRFERTYYPFSLELEDFRFDPYVGTRIAKNYSSDVILRDPSNNVERPAKIWMNNPLRYAGLTFYQSGFDEQTEKTTILQVVKNPSWMTPYVACMIVGVGMLTHFMAMLWRFLERRAEDSGRRAVSQRAGAESHPSTVPYGNLGVARRWAVPALILAVFAGYALSKARMPKSGPSEMRIYDFGSLPVAYEGRIKPYDTLARNSLQILSGRQEVIGEEVPGKGGSLFRRPEKTPAITWLLDVISGAPSAADHPVFRIESLELLEVLGLEPRQGSFRYSLNEISKNDSELSKQIELARSQPENSRSLFQRQVLELAGKRHLYTLLAVAFRSPPIAMQEDKLVASLQHTQQLIEELRATQTVHAVPPRAGSEGEHWVPLLEAEFRYLIDHVGRKELNPATQSLRALLDAYATNNVAAFNKELDNYQTILKDFEQSLGNRELASAAGADAAKAELYSQRKADFEVFFNQFSPFYYSAVLYLIAFVLGAIAWLGWTEPLRRSSIALLWFTFALHTFALVGRIYISGRPPVTNLYSSAVFIGWACVLFALLFESIYKIGIGNIVAAVIGFLTLLVAHFLSLDGDTFKVLQAVLDTQFWLATHVVCITLGYSTTFLAGMFGIMYILLAHVFPVLDDNARKQVTRMTYGTLCFAIFFSFIGTVLGGLWADDSWGRFWGWDPKENGALIIVLYIALVLHARWGGMIKARGLALLAIGGNIITTWSWFGVNELGVGLHAYGGSESKTALWLLVFALSQLAMIAIGSLPRHWFDDRTAARAVTPA